MIRVLVVDDEEYQRRGLIRHVNWNKYGMTIIGEAESAQEALHISIDNPPDLLITDIRMLGDDGFELSRSMRIINCDVKIIIITGFGNVEYAKTAINIGINAFIIKPIDFSELEASLKEIEVLINANIEKNYEEKSLREKLYESLPLARETFLYKLICGLAGTGEQISCKSEYLGLFDNRNTHAVVIISREHHRKYEKDDDEKAATFDQNIKMIAKDVLIDIFEEAVSISPFIVLVIKYKDSHGYDSKIKCKLSVFQSEVELIMNENINISVGPVVDSPHELSFSYSLAKKAIRHKLISEPASIVWWKDCIDSELNFDVKKDQVIEDIYDGLQIGDKDIVASNFKTIILMYIESETISDAEIKGVCMELVSKAVRYFNEYCEPSGDDAYNESILWKRLGSCSETVNMIDVTREIMFELCDYVMERKQSRSRSIVMAVAEFIDKNYMNTITLQSVAEEVFLSPNYLGAIIRTELGISFSEYISRKRIEEAKKLLVDPKNKLSSISIQVGYQNPAYFCFVFRRYVGLTPREFRNLQMNK